MNKMGFFLLIITLASCNLKKDEYLITNNSAGFLRIGMDINEARHLFLNNTFEDIDLARFGLDGGDTGILVKKLNEPLVVFWSTSDSKKVNGIICLDSNYHTKDGIRPKMTVEELKKIVPSVTIQINNINPGHEFIELVNERVYLDFLSTDKTRIGRYKLEDSEEATTEMRSDARIDNIWIKEK
jgi:hypothetical protein